MEIKGFSTQEKKQCKSRFCNGQEGFRRKRLISAFLFGIAVVFLLGFFLPFAMLGNEETNSAIPLPVVGLLMGAVLGLLPFLVGRAVLVKARAHFGRPYTMRSHEEILLDDDSISYMYHPTDWPDFEGMSCYRICYSNIQRIIFDQSTHILNIQGEGSLQSYDDLMMTIPDESIGECKVHEYSILLAVEDAEGIVTRLQEKVKGGN